MREKELAGGRLLLIRSGYEGDYPGLWQVGTLEPTHASSADNFDESGRNDTTFEDSNLAHALRDMVFDGAVL
jgi:hypothetical protein